MAIDQTITVPSSHLRLQLAPPVMVALLLANVPTASADDTNDPQEQYKSGYSNKPAFGGPNSPQGQLEEDDRVKEPVFRLPKAYSAFAPWRDWKRGLNEKHGLQFSGHYSSLYQKANTSVTGEDTASSGVFRMVAQWTAVGRGTPNTGTLVLMVDHRHAYRDIAPASLGGELGYIGVTGTLYSDVDWVVPNFNWQQRFNNTGLLVGRYDPNDYMNILGYVNPWVSFSNVSVLLEPSIAFPDSSWGAGVGHWFNDQWYVLGGLNDANGTINDNFEFFDGGAEFFTYAEAGWSPSKSERYFSNIHLTAWQVDERDDLGIEAAHGFAFAANWTFDGIWMPFVRAGWSHGSAPIYNKSATAGLIRKLRYRSDLLGIGFNWGDPPDASLREQKTLEAFWNIQLAQNLALTPSIQLLLDPALNPDDDRVWVGGIRARLTF